MHCRRRCPSGPSPAGVLDAPVGANQHTPWYYGTAGILPMRQVGGAVLGREWMHSAAHVLLCRRYKPHSAADVLLCRLCKLHGAANLTFALQAGVQAAPATPSGTGGGRSEDTQVAAHKHPCSRTTGCAIA